MPADRDVLSQPEEEGELWERVTTAYHVAAGTLAEPAAGSNFRTEEARRRAAARAQARASSAVTVDLYVDPVCPYTWLAACWLREVERHRELDLRYHVMSLRMLNEQRVTDDGYRESVEGSIGPSRVATAVWTHYGPDALRRWHTAFGSVIFDRWRYPTPEEYRTAATLALRSAGLPLDLVEAADSDRYDPALRRSHQEGIEPVGVEAGTPVIHLAGVAFFGPVLNAVPTPAQALALFDGVRHLTGCRDFFELKRTRTSPPLFTHSSGTTPEDAPEGPRT
jgi:hypothetical protein